MSSNAFPRSNEFVEGLKRVRQYLLTGVSYAIPFVACGGIMIACAIAFAPMTDTGPGFLPRADPEADPGHRQRSVLAAAAGAGRLHLLRALRAGRGWCRGSSAAT